ncbi:MAG: hypothetical protein H7A25_21080 [Leptospiraceae bacterium]|nr:hypothetical protein [Leptospiraceae bacterium]MCP5502404.1 hypothetical protein [Leptospiraceae bacterium]
MFKIRKILIHLSGILDRHLSRDLQKEILDVSPGPALILLNFSDVSAIEVGSSDYLPETFQNSGMYLYFGIAGLKEESHSQLSIFAGDKRLEFFQDVESGKAYFEHFEKDLEEKLKRANAKKKGVIIRCPGCDARLRVRSRGNHQCPSCKSKFTILPDMSIVLKK